MLIKCRCRKNTQVHFIFYTWHKLLITWSQWAVIIRRILTPAPGVLDCYNDDFMLWPNVVPATLWPNVLWPNVLWPNVLSPNVWIPSKHIRKIRKKGLFSPRNPMKNLYSGGILWGLVVTGADLGILRGQGPRKGKSVWIFILTSTTPGSATE